MAGFFTRSKNDMKYLFANKDELSKKERRRKRRGWATVIGIILVLIQLVLTVLMLKNVFILDILPTKYMIALTVFLVCVLLYDFTSQFTNSKFMGKILAVLLSFVMLYCYIFSAKVVSTLTKITGVTSRTDIMDVIVLSDDEAESIADTAKYTYAYSDITDDEIYASAVNQLEKENNIHPSLKTYDNWDTTIDELLDNSDVQAVLVSEEMLTSLEEADDTLASNIKVIGTVEVVTTITVEEADKVSASEPFVIFVSGNDDYGTVKYNGHSDVNILAVVNPDTRQILLVSTPRDSYITIGTDSGKSGLDKLTHAGNAGVDNTIKALENLYGIDVNYYVRLNFSGCIGVVDALGGITVDSEVAFTNGDNAWYENFTFNEGENELNGEQTLAFVRERMAFANGDFQRARNQIAAIKGIINKATSASILSNYATVLDAVSDMILTDMPTSFITQLVKEQLSDTTAWNIQSYSLTGSTGSANGQVYGLSGMSVVFLDDDSVNTAIQLMSKIMNGETFDVDEYVESLSTTAE
ncbi:LCP family protein [Lachnospira pectinoschiza]|uniref:Transcriptional attenuator, LytR family n=1 Tax=Lachnospira pectinoschiza TaxID=28052 RepID=A0A1G9TRL9_9FIRM|nr:LCP family protein [Lachnospira pectinoschiza]SDM50409.1 transcriptional attenuator, LytR family [Lachnospira pectinoschiza]